MTEKEEFFKFKNQIGQTFTKTDNHFHDYYEIYYLTQGRCWYFIGDRSYLLTEGDVAFIAPGVIHKTSYETSVHARKLVWCSGGYVPQSVRLALEKTPYYSGSGSDAIKKYFCELERELNFPDEYSDDAVKAIMSELLLTMARSCVRSKSVSAQSPVVEKVVRYIAQNYKHGVSLKQAAEYCFISREHLSRTFRRETGFGFSEYVNVYRLKKADSILRSDSRKKVVDVAMECGFNDSNYFSKLYKKMFGVSPKQISKK